MMYERLFMEQKKLFEGYDVDYEKLEDFVRQRKILLIKLIKIKDKV